MTTQNQEPWRIDFLVSELRRLRLTSLEARQRRDHPPKLPSRKALTQIVDDLAAALFPNRLGQPDISPEEVDYFVGNTLASVLRRLSRQIALELQFNAEQNQQVLDAHVEALALTQQFAAGLPDIRALIDTDIKAAFEGDPAARSIDEVLVCYPGVNAMMHQRIAHRLYRFGAHLSARMIAEIAHSATGIDIHPGAEIGESFFIDHGTGVVIGETAVIGRRVRIYQAVTLGAKRFDKDEQGILVKGNARHPIVEDDVVIYAGATILGRIVIGQGSVIGGNVWLTHSVPPGSQVTQAHVRS